MAALASVVTAQADPIYPPAWWKPGVARSTPRAPVPGDAAAEAVLKELLAKPAPPPRNGDETAETHERPDDFFDEDKAPPEDAPLEDLLDYWQKTSNTGGPDGPKITDLIKERLLTACEANPAPLTNLLDCLPDGPEAAERVQRIYDASLNNPNLDDEWRGKVRNWLRLNSTVYLGDLVRLANKAKDGENGIENEEQLEALAKVDRASALPVLRSLLASAQPRTSTLAITLLYRYAVEDGEQGDEERYRSQLRTIAPDRAAPGTARSAAIEALTRSDWTGRDEWYLSLFADESLLELTDTSPVSNPLTALFNSDPPKWIPILAEMVESKDRAVRRNAGNCLALYAKDHGRREAMMPLIRSLREPAWLDLDGQVRNALVEKLQTVVIPESVPGLIWIVANDDPSQRMAAKTLAVYRDARAIPVLKQALLRANREDQRQDLLTGLFACGGLSDAEGLEGLEAFAKSEMQNDGEVKNAGLPYLRYAHAPDEETPLTVSIGQFLVLQSEVPETLANLVFLRVEQLQRTDPALAQSLLTIAQNWKGRRVDLDLVQRLGAGTADASLIGKALDRRDDLTKTVPVQLRALSANRGTAAGIVAVILGDAGLAQQVLGGRDQLSQLGLLAGARLVQMKLPLNQVGMLLRSPMPLLAQAAEKYLLAEDSREARQLLWERFPQQGYVTGWRERKNMIGADLSVIEKTESALHDELMAGAGAPQQVFALLETTTEPRRVIRVYADRVTDTFYADDSRYTERTLSPEATASFRRFLAESQLTDGGPQLEDCSYDCRLAEFLAVARGGGRRVMVAAGGVAWQRILDGFGIAAPGEAKTHYYLQNEIPGSEVVIEARPSFSVKQIVQEAGTLQVQLQREPTPEENELNRQEQAQAQLAEEAQLDTADAIATENYRRRAERGHARVTWHALVDGRLSTAPSSPVLADLVDADRLEIEPGDFPEYWNERPAQGLSSSRVILAGGWGKAGLWSKAVGEAPALLTGERMYTGPVVTPNGRWVVAARARSNWAEPNDIVRLNLSTGVEYQVDLPGAHQFEAIAYVPASGKVLLRRARDDDDDPKDTEAGPPNPEFYLLDAETGKTQLVKGEFDPLIQANNRRLQPTGKPDEVWVALPDTKKNETRLGRYNLRTFTLQTALTVPRISFTSEAMWVDEAKGKVYIVYEGQLIGVPLAGSPR
jgi:hypothetical protein